MKIDHVLKGRLKWYEKSTKRKVNYKRSLRLGALKWNYYNLHSGNFWIVTLWIRNRVDAKYGYIYIYFPFDVTRSRPVLYHEYCIQDGNLLPTFSLLLLTLLLPIFTTHALLSGYVQTRKLDLKMDTCGRGNFWIRKEVVADSKIPGYVWRGPGWTIGWFATKWAVSEWYSSKWPSSTKSLSASGTSMQSVQMILTLRRCQKGWQ